MDENEGGRKKFRTSGNVGHFSFLPLVNGMLLIFFVGGQIVAVVSLISIAAYSTLLVLLCKLQGE